MTTLIYERALNHKTLTRERESVVFAKYAARKARLGVAHPKVVRLRNKIVTSFLRMVAALAKRFRSLPFEDLMGEGVKGLITAVERFEPERGWRFQTFARYWVRHTLQRACEDTGYIVKQPLYMQTAIRRGVASKNDGVDLLGTPRSMDAALCEDGSCLHDVLVSEGEDTGEVLGRHHTAMAVCRTVLATLEGRDRDIIERRFLCDEPQTLHEVGLRWGVTRKRVRQLEGKALARLRKAMLKQEAFV